MKEFPYDACMKHRDWSPAVHRWLIMRVGTGNFRYHKPQNAYLTLRYAFKNAEDATAFTLIFSK